jgi:hypothetical protein
LHFKGSDFRKFPKFEDKNPLYNAKPQSINSNKDIVYKDSIISMKTYTYNLKSIQFEIGQSYNNLNEYLYIKLKGERSVFIKIKNGYDFSLLGYSSLDSKKTKLYFGLKNNICNIYFSIFFYEKNKFSITQYDNK